MIVPPGLTASLRKKRQLLLEKVSLEGLALLTFQRLGQHPQVIENNCVYSHQLAMVKKNIIDFIISS